MSETETLAANLPAGAPSLAEILIHTGNVE